MRSITSWIVFNPDGNRLLYNFRVCDIRQRGREKDMRGVKIDQF